MTRIGDRKHRERSRQASGAYRSIVKRMKKSLTAQLKGFDRSCFFQVGLPQTPAPKGRAAFVFVTFVQRNHAPVAAWRL
jgi:hypothetical protein